ncbi:hypothetical protein INQ51_01660 [Maribellus sp. CM-23]|uniref:hypothetical protein n=1 Tax=Maribellus sp. CM-23 TaxID=2781026 RepID=UPI001F320D26|nr:hypothetical protein [Maribellus sp. CM-23]MCE4563005.1 hypothetical protein [Maribellus sp. CM-23]
MKGSFKYIMLITGLFALLVYLESIAPQDVDWRQSFSGNDKIPFGTWVLRHELDTLFPNAAVTDVRTSFYEYEREGSDLRNSLLIVTNNFNPDSLDMDFLYRKAGLGADVFIAANYFNEALADSFKFEIKNKLITVADSVTTLQVWDGSSWGESLQFRKNVQSSWFSLADSSQAIPLGKGNNNLNFIKIPCGNGNFLLHSAPLVFTNYHTLYNNSSYQEQLLGWFSMPTGTLEWDEYYKPFRIDNRSPLKIILANKSLAAAYWTLLIGLVFYIVTNVLRRQRVIPVLKAKNNLSLDFVQTIGLLYYNQKDHKDLVGKIFAAFLEYINSRYFVRFDNSDDFYRKLAQKSGVSEKTVKMIFKRYQVLSEKKQVYEDELFQFNSLVEQFYRDSRQVATKRQS